MSQENLNAKEELVFHAKSQIVILSQSFLDWIYHHPGLIIGNLFKDGSKVIGLMLGIIKDHVKMEHRSELVTFGIWKYYFQIKPKDHENLSKNLVGAVASMVPVTMTSYICPRPIIKQFQVWPKIINEENCKMLLLLTEKVSRHTDKIKIQAEVFIDEQMSIKKDIKNFKLIQDTIIEITFSEYELNGVFMKIKLEINDLKLVLDQQQTGIIQIRKNPLQDIDQYLSSYLEQMNSGSIEIKNKKVPTLLHYAGKHGMIKLARTIFQLPGGLQMASMVNEDGLNARDLAIHAGHLDLAKLLKANSDQPQQPRDYEFPVLRQFTPPMSPMSDTNSYYDIPRNSEQFYVVPPPPRPVEAKKGQNNSTSYVPMLPKMPAKSENPDSHSIERNECSKSEDVKNNNDINVRPIIRAQSLSKEAGPQQPPNQPQSRQELIMSLKKTRSLEVLHDDIPSLYGKVGMEKDKMSLDFESNKIILDKKPLLIDDSKEPKSPLSIVTPFPVITVASKRSENTKSLYGETQEELINIQNMFKKGELTLQQVESKFEVWKSRPDVMTASTNHKTEVEDMKKDWENVRKNLKKNDNDSLLKRMKNRKKKSLSDLKFSTLPSMPLRLRKPSRSTSSLLQKEERVKSLSESSTCSTENSDSSWSAETSASNVDKFMASEAEKSSKNQYDNVVIVKEEDIRLSD